MPDDLSERDEVTLRVLAMTGRTTLAEQRRLALRAYAAGAREDEYVAEIVRLILACRRRNASAGGNVIRLRGREARRA